MKVLLSLIVVGFLSPVLSQSFKGEMFLYWGYNRSSYTNSDIHFRSDSYNFTLHSVVARDRPTRFDTKTYFNIELFTIPQYNYRVGYFITDNIAMSIGLDHLKYVMRDNQYVSITGRIDKEASTVYAGNYQNEEVLVGTDFLQFEHSDGLNFASIDAEYYYAIPKLQFKNGGGVYGIGGVALGAYIPKTKINLFNNNVDNAFHLAGFGGAVNLKLRVYPIKHLFLSFDTRAGWAFLPDILVDGGEARASQNFGWTQFAIQLGGQFPLKRNKASE